MEAMTREHPRWKEFLDRLCGEEGCNFQMEEGKPETTTWECYHDYRFTQAILADIGTVNILKSIEYFQKYGGFCDCEICFNVLT